MDILTGNTIIFTDLHCGLAGNRLSRLNICVNVVKDIIDKVKKNDVKTVIFGGDWFHSRSMLDNNTINVSLKLVQGLAKYCKLYMIVGNHDAYLKNSTDINSLNVFRENKNVIVVDKASEISLNGARCLLAPWLTDMTLYDMETFDILIGHFDISSRYLVKSYIESNAAKQAATALTSSALSADGMLTAHAETSDLVGDFVETAKKDGVIYAGHIHTHKEFISKGREFVFVGSPYQQNLGEIDSDCGFYLLDSHNSRKFIHTSGVPKHVRLYVSKAVSGEFDFSECRGNIVQKIYDIDVTRKEEADMTQKISDSKPYEELFPEYLVQAASSSNSDSEFSVDVIRKSKLEYIRSYVDKIDQAALDQEGLDRDRLFETLKKYYDAVTKE